MFKCGFNDNKHVCHFMQLIYEFYGHLSKIMIPNETNVQPELHRNLVHYFLLHANEAELQIAATRISNLNVFYDHRYIQPVEYAAGCSNLKLLQEILRFGATMSYENNCIDKRIKTHKYCKFIFRILAKFVQIYCVQIKKMI